MIKKQQKWIAVLVTLTFVWLLQVSTMPALAADSAEQISSANAEQGPRFIEEEEGGGYKAKKSSALPIILIGVGVAAVAAVLFLVVLKTKYDITGEWLMMRTRTDITAPVNPLSDLQRRQEGRDSAHRLRHLGQQRPRCRRLRRGRESGLLHPVLARLSG